MALTTGGDLLGPAVIGCPDRGNRSQAFRGPTARWISAYLGCQLLAGCVKSAFAASNWAVTVSKWAVISFNWALLFLSRSQVEYQVIEVEMSVVTPDTRMMIEAVVLVNIFVFSSHQVLLKISSPVIL